MQETVYDQIIYNECLPSHAQAIRMQKLSKDGLLTDAIINKIMKEEKPNQIDKIHIPYSEIRKYIPRGISCEKTGEYIK